MDIKWLEDFVSLARTRSFSRSAQERHVTQSAFSRRIQALETWAGVALVDRSRYPTSLTPEGQQFRETAEDMLRQLQDSKAALQARPHASRQSVSVAALHSLALAFFPPWLRSIEDKTGALDSRLLPDDFHNCLQAVVEGNYDFLLTYHHPDMPVLLDPEAFPHVVVGQDSLVAVHHPALSCAEGDAPPLLDYSRASFLGRISGLAQSRADFRVSRATHVNENAMAEALRLMAMERYGIAWVPCSLAESDIVEGRLVTIGAAVPLEIRLYRKAAHKRTVVEQVWNAARDASLYANPE